MRGKAIPIPIPAPGPRPPAPGWDAPWSHFNVVLTLWCYLNPGATPR